MNVSKYFWDLNPSALQETQRALKDSSDPLFSQRVITLLTRCDKPKELFSIITKQVFIREWPRIRREWVKLARQSHQRDWWETIYEQCVKPMDNKSPKAKGEPASFLKQLGLQIKQTRIAKGLNQQQLAFQAGIKQPLVSHIEMGKSNLTIFTMLRLFKVLGLKLRVENGA